MSGTVFGARPGGYQWGFAFLLISTVAFLIGFASPYWSKIKLTVIHLGFFRDMKLCENVGLWEVCVSMERIKGKCASTSHLLAPGWFSSVKALECVCLVALLAACAYAIVINWVQRRPRFSRLLELTAALGGLAGSIGVIVYISNATDQSMMTILLNASNSQIWRNHVSWAFWMTAAGCGLSMISSILIAIFNRQPLNIPDLDTTGPLFDPDTGMPLDRSALTDFDLMTGAADGEVYCIPTQAMAVGFNPPSYESLGLDKDILTKPPSYESSCPLAGSGLSAGVLRAPDNSPETGMAEQSPPFLTAGSSSGLASASQGLATAPPGLASGQEVIGQTSADDTAGLPASAPGQGVPWQTSMNHTAGLRDGSDCSSRPLVSSVTPPDQGISLPAELFPGERNPDPEFAARPDSGERAIPSDQSPVSQNAAQRQEPESGGQAIQAELQVSLVQNAAQPDERDEGSEPSDAGQPSASQDANMTDEPEHPHS
ncbi:hypothetical protein BaRGS_00001009 [Batillaria attramentaria]|uniref:Uncharacterized protein n=1 Tax=Batillaria attramentaria TaxID=370345 RepID=A0ABD0M9B0_9CAEN